MTLSNPSFKRLDLSASKRLKLEYVKLLTNFAFKFKLRRYTWLYSWDVRGTGAHRLGRAVQVDPMKCELKAPKLGA